MNETNETTERTERVAAEAALEWLRRREEAREATRLGRLQFAAERLAAHLRIVERRKPRTVASTGGVDVGGLLAA